MSRALAGWNRFWFEPQKTSSLALFRIAFGLLATAWTATQGPNLIAFYGRDGVLPNSAGPGSWGLLDVSDRPGFLVGVFVATLVACVALTFGLFTRVASVVVWAGIVSFEHRNGFVTNSGDGLVRNLAFLCVLAPCGEALSLDRFRRDREHFWEFPERAPWALRLIQIQLSVGYLSAFWAKSGNSLWREGTAVSYSLRIADIHRWAITDAATHSVLAMNLLTYGTLAVELSLGLLIWNRTLRPWLLLAGIGLHLSIDASIMVGFFSLAMITAYLSFLPPDTAARLIVGLRERAERQAHGRLRRLPAPTLLVPEPLRQRGRDESLGSAIMTAWTTTAPARRSGGRRSASAPGVGRGPTMPASTPTSSRTATGATSSTATATGPSRRSSPTSTADGTRSPSRSRTSATT